jgi:hypothetical protein
MRFPLLWGWVGAAAAAKCDFTPQLDYRGGSQQQPDGWPKRGLSTQKCCDECAAMPDCAAAVWGSYSDDVSACYYKDAEDIKNPGPPFGDKKTVACLVVRGALAPPQPWAQKVLLVALGSALAYGCFALFNAKVRAKRGINVLPLMYEARGVYGLVVDGVAFTTGGGRRQQHPVRHAAL